MPPPSDPPEAPPDERYRANMRASMVAIEVLFPDVAVGLFLFDKHNGAIRGNYISNARRETMLAAIKEWIKRQEASDAG